MNNNSKKISKKAMDKKHKKRVEKGQGKGSR